MFIEQVIEEKVLVKVFLRVLNIYLIIVKDLFNLIIGIKSSIFPLYRFDKKNTYDHGALLGEFGLHARFVAGLRILGYTSSNLKR